MFIKFSKETFELGDSIPAEIIFVNTSSEVVSLPEHPQKSLDLIVHAVNAATGEDLNYSVREPGVTRLGKDQFALTVPVKEKFELQPKSMFSFISDLNSRLYLAPGTYECFLTNYLVEKSNKVTLTVSFTTGTVSYLLKTALDERMGYGKREWAYEWLKKIDSRFELQLTHEDDTDEQRYEKKVFNQRTHAQFEKWWNENRKNEEIIREFKS